MTHRITKCRICGNENLSVVLDLGEQTLSGIFPDKPELEHKSPLRLLKCDEKHTDVGTFSCGHIQMEYTFTPEIMYGEDYGYRSGLNKSMVAHLKGRVDEIIKRFEGQPKVSLEEGDIVVDIAGNDGTTLGFYPSNLRRINIDPTSEKFKEYQPEGVEHLAAFFSGASYQEAVGDPPTQAKVITAFSVFYDVEDPREFLRDVKSNLDPEGLAVFEQSYMPAMFKALSYDTVCHEHLSYYALRQFQYMFKDVGFKIVDVSFNKCNGGSFVVTAAHEESVWWEEDSEKVKKIQDEEFLGQYHTLPVWEKWTEMIEESRDKLKKRIKGKKVAALGASTKGNVLLQYCGLGPEDIEVVGDVNPDKKGCYTPGTWIPITDEDTVLAGDYDYYLVLPWHFKDFFVKNEKFKGKTLLFPLPKVHAVTVK
jgi:NDP-4-keto-2,6-dideoxyhexose 3-C-methyltransferase